MQPGRCRLELVQMSPTVAAVGRLVLDSVDDTVIGGFIGGHVNRDVLLIIPLHHNLPAGNLNP